MAVRQSRRSHAALATFLGLDLGSFKSLACLDAPATVEARFPVRPIASDSRGRPRDVERTGRDLEYTIGTDGVTGEVK